MSSSPPQGLPGKDGPPGRQGPPGTMVSDLQCKTFVNLNSCTDGKQNLWFSPGALYELDSDTNMFQVLLPLCRSCRLWLCVCVSSGDSRSTRVPRKYRPSRKTRRAGTTGKSASDSDTGDDIMIPPVRSWFTPDTESVIFSICTMYEAEDNKMSWCRYVCENDSTDTEHSVWAPGSYTDSSIYRRQSRHASQTIIIQNPVQTVRYSEILHVNRETKKLPGGTASVLERDAVLFYKKSHFSCTAAAETSQWEVTQTAHMLLCMAVIKCCHACNYVGGLQRAFPPLITALLSITGRNAKRRLSLWKGLLEWKLKSSVVSSPRVQDRLTVSDWNLILCLLLLCEMHQTTIQLN